MLVVYSSVLVKPHSALCDVALAEVTMEVIFCGRSLLSSNLVVLCVP